MKYLEFDNTYGRLSNHFYLVLQAYKYSKLLQDKVKYIKNKAVYDFNLHQAFIDFNLIDYIVDRNELDINAQCFKNTDHISHRYHQLFNVDFTLNELELFIKDTFLKSSAFTNIHIDNNDITVAIHIRNGDYINDKGLDIFDRFEYITKSFSLLDNSIQNLVVYSDNNVLNKKLYDQIFKQKFKHIVYVEGTTGQNDFIHFTLHKNKILWNSTFSYWAAFIGNVIYKDSYDKIIAPAKFGFSDPIGDHVNPLWNNIKVNFKGI